MMTVIKYQKATARWRQFAMASISEAINADHAAVIPLPVMQE
jgi:hypothetical protein